MFLRQLHAMTDSRIRKPSSSLQPSAVVDGNESRKTGTISTGRELPVRKAKSRIVEKVQENRVTLIFADTGSGKSSQVPQMLLEEGLGPVLCTQPRRLAVASVAKRVAEERGCILGTEVGYQIGQVNHSTPRSKIMFKTAGVLLEELRTNGVAALTKYKVVILDEVHERSVESDLVLTCVKQLLRATSVKLVLMSATADLLKYEAYFKDFNRGEGVEKIAIQNLADKLQSMIRNTKVSYLEQVVKLLGNKPEHVSTLEKMIGKKDPDPGARGSDLGVNTLTIIKDLIVHLHLSEPDLSRNVLVFLPTYRSLEEEWALLKKTREQFEVFVLHSSVDVDDSIRVMEASPYKRRKVILATNVAESSVTIPGVSFVIDSCRSLEIFWDRDQKKHKPRLRWISESQANQRKGRTGRTCEGVVYRMVPRNEYLQFEKFETPAMQLISLKKQVLMIITSVSKALNDPAGLLKKCMNPPPLDTVNDALEALEDMEAIEMDIKAKHLPTLYGRLLISLPLSLESSVMVVRGGQLGYPRESAILAAILDGTPNPILKPFGAPRQMNLSNYYSKTVLGEEVASHSTIMLANMYAYEFWQRSFKDKQRLDKLSQRANPSAGANGSVSLEAEDSELDWCSQHQLSLTSLRSVADTVEAIMETLHRFRPEFLHKASGPPTYVTTNTYPHTCRLILNDDESGNVLNAWSNWPYQESELKSICDEENTSHKNGSSKLVVDDKICAGVPFTSCQTFHSVEEEQLLSALIVEVQKGYDQPLVTKLEEQGTASRTSTPLCSYFQRGICVRGHNCNFSHSTLAQPTPCRFFLSATGCRFGDSCMFYHHDPNKYFLPPNDEPLYFDETPPTAESMLDLLPHELQTHEYLLLFGEGNFSFAQSLTRFFDARQIIATALDKEEIFTLNPAFKQTIDYLHQVRMPIYWGVDVTSLMTCASREKTSSTQHPADLIPWWGVKYIIWNFPFANEDENAASHEQLMVNFFASLSIMMRQLKLASIPVLITLCSDQYCRWRVGRAARASFFFLRTSSPFDTDTFGGYQPMRNNLQSTFPVKRPLLYMFEHHIPTGST